MELPPMTNEALDLEKIWRTNFHNPSPFSRKDMIGKIFSSLRFLPEKIDDPLLQLPPYAWMKQRLLMRYRVSINAFLWLWALKEVAFDRAHSLLRSVEPFYLADGKKKKDSWTRIMLDIEFFETILDNYKEEGFLSIAEHVVWRVHGDFKKNPHLLEIAVALAFHMDRIFEECRNIVYQWAGREPSGGMDRITGLLDADVFSGNF